MQFFKLGPTLIGAFISIILLTACSDSDEVTSSALNSEDGLLRFVPADTPYMIATPGDMPDDVMDKLEPQIDTVLKAYHSILRAMIENAYAKARDEDSDLSFYEKVMPVVDELESLMSIDGMRQAGIERNADFAIYGTGLLPVFRLSLSDGALLEAAIARLEEQAEQNMSLATISGQSYRYAGNDEGRVVVAIIDNDLVITVVPTALPDDLFKQVLGLELPAENIAKSGLLGEIAEAYGFNDYMVGYLDFERVVATFLDEQTGVNAALLPLMEFENTDLTDACKAEIRSVAGVMPRIVMGYTELNTERMSSKMVMELRDDIAAGVATLTGVVPGIAEPQGGLFSIGMSMDLLAARTFYSERLDALEAQPFECDQFAEFQQGVAAGREVLNQPVPPVAYGFKGFLAVVEGLEGMNLANGVPPTSADMRLLVAMDNAESLIAMGAMFSPELAAMNIETDGEPVKLAMPQIDATGMDVFVAMTDNALGLSVGDGMQDGLGDMLKAAAADPSPFLVVDMDAERYYSFIDQAISAQSGNQGDMPEVLEATQAMSQSIQKMMDRVRMVVNFTENGIEIESEVQLAE